MGRLSKAPRPSPAIVVAALAVVAAVAGTAFAGPQASTSAINKKKVKKIATKQINKLAPELSVASAESADTASTANTAATANTALNANAVGNVKVRRVSFRANNGTGPTQILNVGGLRLTASCTGSVLAVVARTTANGSWLLSYSQDAAGAGVDNNLSEFPFDVGETRNLVFFDDFDKVGHTRFATPGGSTVTLEWMADNVGAPDCFFTGHAMQSG